MERLWRTLKYEEVYLRSYSDGWDAEINLAHFLWRYCYGRPHSSLVDQIPYAAYTELETCSSRPEITMFGSKTVQQNHLRLSQRSYDFHGCVKVSTRHLS